MRLGTKLSLIFEKVSFKTRFESGKRVGVLRNRFPDFWGVGGLNPIVEKREELE